MVRRRKKNGAAVAKPGWLDDVDDQKKWTDRFIRILERDYGNLDPTISAILSNEGLSKMCAVKIRSYVDPRVTAYLYSQRKARGMAFKNQLQIAIPGLKAAADLYAQPGKQDISSHLNKLVVELSGMRDRWKYAFATKRHGRDRAHSTLSEARFFLGSRLNQPITCATLANLVTAGYEAEGNPSNEPVTEEQIRKNLAEFERNNPLWFNVSLGPK